MSDWLGRLFANIMDDKKLICFVILHYNTIEETRKCISTIMMLEHSDCSRVVIVDNASPNQSGRLLVEDYSFDENVDVILRKSNDGFSAGNNAGCAYAIKKWDPDFLIVANNDVEFCQKDFITRIYEEYERNPFAILGPDIYSPVRNMHQSPLDAHPPSRNRVMTTIVLNQLMLWLFPLVYPVMKIYFKHIESNAHVENYKIYQENVCLMGACMVYSREYMNARDKIFEPDTKFYYEEYIQTLWCLRHNKKIVYEPDIVVYHMEGKATETIDKLEKERVRFRMYNILDAAKVYWKYIKKEI